MSRKEISIFHWNNIQPFNSVVYFCPARRGKLTGILVLEVLRLTRLEERTQGIFFVFKLFPIGNLSLKKVQILRDPPRSALPGSLYHGSDAVVEPACLTVGRGFRQSNQLCIEPQSDSRCREVNTPFPMPLDLDDLIAIGLAVALWEKKDQIYEFVVIYLRIQVSCNVQIRTALLWHNLV